MRSIRQLVEHIKQEITHVTQKIQISIHTEQLDDALTLFDKRDELIKTLIEHAHGKIDMYEYARDLDFIKHQNEVLNQAINSLRDAVGHHLKNCDQLKKYISADLP